MDNLMMLFGDDIINRYNTLLENIKNESSSFYDSYNALLEQLLKSLVDKDIKGSVHTLINDKEINNILINEVKVDPKVIKKILDYASKINKHKHSLEKKINQDNVVNYMKAFYDLLFYIAKYRKYCILSFDESYFRSIYAIKVKSLNEYEFKEKEVNDKLETISKDINFLKHNYTQKNNDNYIRKLVNSSKNICSYFSDNEFKNSRKLLGILSLILIFLSLIYALIISINSIESYGILLFISIPYLVYFSIKMFQKHKEDLLYYNNVSFIKIYQNSYGLPFTEGEMKSMPKFMYYMFNIIFFFDNILFISSLTETYNSMKLLLIMFDIIILIISIVLKHYIKEFLESFTIISFTYNNETIYYDCILQKYLIKQNNGEFK